MTLPTNIDKKRQSRGETLPNRKRTRLREYDYSNLGYYFITICIKEKRKILGNIIGSQIILNQYGKIVEKCWQDLQNYYPNCEVDCHVIMPDHFHGIIIINGCSDKSVTRPQQKYHSIFEIIRGFKTFSSKEINKLLINRKPFHWQKSFYDRIIRNEKELYQIRKYIIQNPIKWEIEKLIPENLDI